MKFFSPSLWFRSYRVDPAFDYFLDCTSNTGPRSDVVESKQCGYEICTEPIVGGILLSRHYLEKSTTIKKVNGIYRITNRKHTYENVLDYSHTIGRNILSFADPGTWTYAHSTELPAKLLNTEDLIDYYNHLQFDLAGSVDWPVVDKIHTVVDGKKISSELDLKTKQYRCELSLELAQDFIKCCNRKNHLSFMPFGTIQGYSLSSYQSSLNRILKMGYRYIAIGGLPMYQEDFILDLLPIIKKELNRSGYRPGIHLYGRYPTPQHVRKYLEAGVTSFDNNSPSLQPQRHPCAYFDPNFLFEGDYPRYRCNGVRIPSLNGPLLRKLKSKNKLVYQNVADTCVQAFHAFAEFARTNLNADRKKFLVIYKKMDLLLNEARSTPSSVSKLEKDYERCKQTLYRKPWEFCDCTACKTIGAHAVLVKGPRMNMMVFHNHYVLNTRFLKELSEAEIEAERFGTYKPFDWSELNELNRLKSLRTKIK